MRNAALNNFEDNKQKNAVMKDKGQRNLITARRNKDPFEPLFSLPDKREEVSASPLI